MEAVFVFRARPAGFFLTALTGRLFLACGIFFAVVFLGMVWPSDSGNGKLALNCSE